MVDAASPKKLKFSPRIGTHSGHFHADEALAVYLLRLLPTYSGSSVVRTRNQIQLDTCDIVVDVGGVYDPTLHRYDHHQRSFNATFPDRETKLSSAGLIYMHFGKAIIAQHTGLPVDHQDVQTLYIKLYQDFIEALDAHDNGISVYDPDSIATVGLKKRFRDGSITLGSLVGDMNFSESNETDDEDSRFGKASNFIGEVFVRKLRFASQSWLPAREAVSKSYHSRFEVHPSGRIMALTNSGIPWKEHLHDLEEDVGRDSNEIFYVLYPESATPGANWRVQCVPVSENSFQSRKPLPETWRGLRNSELDQILRMDTEARALPRIPEGAIFVHASGFIGGHKSREGAAAIASQSLDM
ncbi:hypothetical protein FQN57_003709 [Myotisia sp. PD_48]|nr:hypothetical protein FQN57_003709 [Myotisia sp. PD_48]